MTENTRRFAAIIPSDPHVRVILIITVATFIALSALKGGTFLSLQNLTSMALQVSDLGILALAMMLAMIIGGIDLSITATANLSAISSALVMQSLISTSGGLATAAGIVVALVVGLACGAVNGILVGYAKVPAILATLGTLTLYAGFATVLTNGVSIYGFPAELTAIGTSAIAFIPVPLIIMVAVIVAVWLLLNKTPLGLKMFLLGANERASMFSGIRNGRTTLITYLVTGLLSAIAGIVVMARTDSANPNYGASYVLVTIIIVVLGGVSVTGGSGKISGVVLALILLQLLSTGMNMLLVGFGNSNFFRDLAWGVVLLLALTIPRVRRFRQGVRRVPPISATPARGVTVDEIG